MEHARDGMACTAPAASGSLLRATRSRVPQVYHSEVPSEGEPHACGCALLPLNTTTRGPAKRTEGAVTLAP